MKHLKQLTVLSGLLTLGIGYAAGQSASSGPDTEDIIELTPFEVSASSDVGYRATSTLAGSRLNTDLKDVAAPISVLTAEFLEDLGATDIESAMAYVVGIETALTTDFATAENGEISNNSNVTPGNNRVRGLARADITMDFFAVSNSNLDLYNVERVTVVRGPNSVLFGLGSPAGIIDYNTKRATTGRDFGQVGIKIDNFGSLRGTFDYNKSLNDKLALRFMALNESAKGQYADAFEKDNRATLNTIFRPFKGTSIRAGVELTENNARRANYTPPLDQITGWIAAGRPVWDPWNQIGGNNSNPALGTFQDFNTTMVQAYSGGGSDPISTTWASSVNYIDKTANSSNGTTLVTTMRGLNPLDSTRGVGYNMPNVTDPNMFPIFDIDTAALPGNSQNRKDQKYSLIFNQKILNNLYIELAGYKDHMVNNNFSRLGLNEIQVDVNRTNIEDGSANPNYMRPYLSSRGTGNYTENNSETIRANLSYELDLTAKENLFRFLGRHSLSGLYTVQKQDRFGYGSSIGTLTDDQATFTGDWGIYRHWVWDQRYVGDALTPTAAYPTYTTFPSGPTGIGQTFTLRNFLNDPNYVNSPAAIGRTGVLWSNYPNEVEMGVIPGNGSYQTQEITGQGVTLQSYFWDGRIVSLFGWREDEIASTFGGSPDDPARPGARLINDYELWDDGPAADPETGRTSTLGFVFHPTKWSSLFYNSSDNFDITPKRQYANQEIIPNSSGKGSDYGIVMSTSDGKLELKVNSFETSQLNVQGASGIASKAKFGVRTMERLALRAFNDHRLGNNGGEHGIQHHAPMSQAEHDSYFGYRWFDPSAPDRLGPITTNRYFGPNDVEETVDYDASGYEVEVTYNPNKNWRIAFNAAQTETIQSNIGPGLRDYVSARLPLWEHLFGIKSLDANGIATYTNGIHSQNQNPATTTQPSMYSIYYEQILLPLNTAAAAEGKRNVGLAEYSANAITNYQFTSGKLKGFSVGANVRWREGAALGYPVIANENGDGLVFDLDNPYNSDPSINLSLNFSYRTKIMNDKVTWITRFDVKNLVGDDKLMASFINPDGAVAGYRVGREQIFEWSNTFRF